MAGLDPAIHVIQRGSGSRGWPGLRPAMTIEGNSCGTPSMAGGKHLGELGAQRGMAAGELPGEESGADGEGVDPGGFELGDAARRVDRAGDDELAAQHSARLADERQRVGLDRAKGEEVDAGAAERVAAPAILG